MHFNFDFRSNGKPTLFSLIENSDIDAIVTEAKFSSKECLRWTRLSLNGSNISRVLPLHYACFMNIDQIAIKALILSCPSAVHQKESLHNWLPIHIACLKGAPKEIIRLLINAYEDGVKYPISRTKQLPIHLACGSGVSKEVMQELIDAHPLGLCSPDINGWLPIHIACLQNASKEVIQLLLTSCPESAAATTKRGNTPKQCLRKTEYSERESDDLVSLISKCERKVVKTRHKSVPEIHRPLILRGIES